MTIERWMNAIAEAAARNPLLERLIFASVEFLLLALTVWALIALARIRSPRLCAILWLVALAKPIVGLPFAPPISIFALRAPEPAAAPVSSFMPDPSHPTDPTEQSSALLPPADLAAPPPPHWTLSPAWRDPARIALTLWIAGVAAFLSLAAIDRVRIRLLLRAAIAPSPTLLALYENISREIGLRRTPQLLISDCLESPALVGALRPRVVIPAWLAREEGSPELAWALRHELMHRKLGDPAANALRQLAQILFFFHPAAWWVGRRWEEAAERACDRALVSNESEALEYADRLYAILARIHAQRRPALAGGIFATRTQIGQRVAALLTDPLCSPARLGAAAIIGVAILAATAFAVGGGIEKGKKDRKDEEALTTVATESTKDGKKAAIPKLAWQKRFDEVYRLEDGETLKRIMPPFIPERGDFAKSSADSDSSTSTTSFFLHWNGAPEAWGRHCDPGKSGASIRTILGMSTGLQLAEVDDHAGILDVVIDGDWVIREGAKPNQVLRALEEILNRDLQKTIRFDRREVEREVIVARGAFVFHPLQESPDPVNVQVFSDAMGPESAGSFGADTLRNALGMLGDRLGRQVVTDSDEKVAICWMIHKSASADVLSADPKKFNQVLENLGKQTGLTFKRERRVVPVWFIEEEGKETAMPASLELNVKPIPGPNGESYLSSVTFKDSNGLPTGKTPRVTTRPGETAIISQADSEGRDVAVLRVESGANGPVTHLAISRVQDKENSSTRRPAVRPEPPGKD